MLKYVSAIYGKIYGAQSAGLSGAPNRVGLRAKYPICPPLLVALSRVKVNYIQIELSLVVLKKHSTMDIVSYNCYLVVFWAMA